MYVNDLAPVMSAERWVRVQDVFSAALDCEAATRNELVDRHCAGDEELRREVQSLLDSHDRGGLLDQLAQKISAPTLLRARVAAMDWQGRRVAQYTVLEGLGAGAMGLVHKARDERLGRHVALKFLPPHLAAQPNAKQRFLLEARAAAVLDHPNICTIHEIGLTADGQPFIAMALYDAETLQARLARGALPIHDALAIAQQIANGLAKAHEHGVIHRDVKPSNIMLLSDGVVKILDFGVAWVADADVVLDKGTPVGTAAYMSPEQARGDPVDFRTDVWSLAVVLYEMITGARPFAVDNTLDLRHAVLKMEPLPARTLCPNLPGTLDALLHKALAKAPEQRHASMTEMATELAACSERTRAVAYAVSRTESAEPLPAVDDCQLPSGGERRRAAVLVSLLPDYASLVEQLAPPKLEEFMRRIGAVAADVAQRHGGLVNYAFGEEIVCLFGVPIGHEDDDLRAVRAAVELHARARDMSVASELSLPFQLQSGVHAGPVVARKLIDGLRRYEVTGAAVQLAGRLAVAAAQDAILLSPECQRLVAPFVRTIPHQSLVSYTESAPITPHRVIGESGLQTRLEAAEREGLTPYSGRHTELATLEGHLARARAGQGQVVLVAGEAGVGKSRLLHEFRARIDATKVRILQARCSSYDGGAPYLPFADILRAALGLPRHEASGFAVEDVVARICSLDSSLQLFVPLYLKVLSIRSDAYGLQRQLRGDHLQAAVPEALTAFLTAFGRQAPTLFLLEDWHWSDSGSREALRRWAEVIAKHALLVVVTTRPDAQNCVDSACAAVRLDIGPLGFDDSVAIVKGVLQVRRVSDALARRVYERTGGNPFFVEEVCHALLEQGAVAERDGEAVPAKEADTLRLPDTVQAVIRTRLDSLDADALEVLRIASVIGREFSNDVLTEVLGAERSPERAIERLNAAGLIQQSGLPWERGYRFKHVLTQEVTYDSLLGHQRRSLHHFIGCAIERAPGGRSDDQASLLAHHFALAETWAPAVHHGRRAAFRANALGQFTDALATLDHVRQWVLRLPESEERFDLLTDVLLQQERQCEILGQRGRQQLIVDELISLLAPRGASERLSQAYLRQGNLSTLLKRFDAADRMLSTALRICRERGDVTLERHALRSLGLLRWHEERHAEALAITESALAIDRERHDELAVAGDLANLGVILKNMGEYTRALVSLEEALAIPALAQDPTTLVYSLQNLANVHRTLGNLDRALELLQRANDISRTHLLPIQRSFHLMAIAHIFLQQGRIPESLETYEEAVALSRRAHHADGLVQSLRALGEVLFGLGRHPEARPYFEEAATLFSQLEDRAGEAEMCTRLATVIEHSAANSDAEVAWEKVRALRARLGDARGELDALEGIARSARARSAAPDEVIPRTEAALALASTLGEERREAALRNTLGILEWESGHYAQALRHYEIALALLRRVGDRVHEGLALNSLAVTLARLNRHDEARTALEQSILLNRQTGERLLEAHALAALGDVHIAGRRFAVAVECFGQSLELRSLLADASGQQRMRQRLEQVRTMMEE
jgi:serine/threonine protein kinase/tetratricopeptide (TPR) repeat protein